MPDIWGEKHWEIICNIFSSYVYFQFVLHICYIFFITVISVTFFKSIWIHFYWYSNAYTVLYDFPSAVYTRVNLNNRK